MQNGMLLKGPGSDRLFSIIFLFTDQNSTKLPVETAWIRVKTLCTRMKGCIMQGACRVQRSMYLFLIHPFRLAHHHLLSDHIVCSNSRCCWVMIVEVTGKTERVCIKERVYVRTLYMHNQQPHAHATYFIMNDHLFCWLCYFYVQLHCSSWLEPLRFFKQLLRKIIQNTCTQSTNQHLSFFFLCSLTTWPEAANQTANVFFSWYLWGLVSAGQTLHSLEWQQRKDNEVHKHISNC